MFIASQGLRPPRLGVWKLLNLHEGSSIMKPLAFIPLVILIFIAIFPTTAHTATAAPQAGLALRITSVSTLDMGTNTWTIQLSSGDTLRVELRAFDTGGKSPSVGAISNFRDQGWLPILGYYGYATFDQHGIAYHATH